MTNRNYQRGRFYEYRVMKTLREEGYHQITRASSSKGPADVIAYGPGEIRLIQVKSEQEKKSHAGDRAKLRDLMSLLGPHPTVRCELWIYRNGQLDIHKASESTSDT